jgi:hypothetical protein
MFTKLCEARFMIRLNPPVVNCIMSWQLHGGKKLHMCTVKSYAAFFILCEVLLATMLYAVPITNHEI